jgi:hypothetical protein
MQQFSGEYEEVAVWEIVEAIGRWQRVEVTNGGAVASEALLFSCESWHLRCSHPSAPMVFRPSDDGRKEIDAMMEEKQLQLCYVPRSRQDGQRALALQARFELASAHSVGADPAVVTQPQHTRSRGLQLAFQALGFTKLYIDKSEEPTAIPGNPSSQTGEAG